MKDYKIETYKEMLLAIAEIQLYIRKDNLEEHIAAIQFEPYIFHHKEDACPSTTTTTR